MPDGNYSPAGAPEFASVRPGSHVSNANDRVTMLRRAMSTLSIVYSSLDVSYRTCECCNLRVYNQPSQRNMAVRIQRNIAQLRTEEQTLLRGATEG